LSVVIPVFDEEEVLPAFHLRLSTVLDSLPMATEVIYVNDGSRDGSADVLRRLRQTDGGVAVLELSRNFGKEAAVSAGLEHASGDAVVVMDADLQDPPELILELIAAWRDGHDVVALKRRSRAGDGLLKRASAALFYRLLNRVAEIDIPVDVGDFRLLSRRAVEALKQLPERNRYMKGLFAWIGFSHKELPFDRHARAAGPSHWPFLKLLGLALNGITGFTWAPLRIATVVGALTALGALAAGVWIVSKTLIWGEAVPGYPSLMCVILFLGGMQLLALGIQGEYLGRLFDESKRRPLYLLKSVQPARTAARGGQQVAR
jgi:glycosyltransferase involved in cell wall biosynthesis